MKIENFENFLKFTIGTSTLKVTEISKNTKFSKNGHFFCFRRGDPSVAENVVKFWSFWAVFDLFLTCFWHVFERHLGHFHRYVEYVVLEGLKIKPYFRHVKSVKNTRKCHVHT